MNIDDALRIVDGCLYSENSCRICQSVIEWFIPMKGAHIEPIGRVRAEMIVDKSCIVSGAELWADFSVIFKCPHCGVNNKYSSIKWKVK